MSSRLPRWTFAAITAAGIGTAALAVPATASAATSPTTPVPGTSCTLGQVERSIDANAPQASGYLRNPEIRAEFERVVTLPVDARRAEVARYLDQYPQLERYRSGVALIASTCSRF